MACLFFGKTRKPKDKGSIAREEYLNREYGILYYTLDEISIYITIVEKQHHGCTKIVSIRLSLATSRHLV